MGQMEIAVAVLASLLAVAVLVVVAQVIVIVKLSKRKADLAADAVKIKNGVRYSKNDQVVTVDGQTKVTHRPDDIILKRGETYRAGKKADFLPGQYTVLSAAEGVDSFTISLNGVVQTYTHNSHLVLADGAEISPRSADVVLR